MASIEEINRELAAIIDQLNATPDDDFAARYRLQLRQYELREQAAQFRIDYDQTRTTEDLEAELAARESQLEALYEAGIDLVTQSGGGSSTGGSYTSAAEGGLNEQIRRAQDAPAIKARIAKLRDILQTRAEESDLGGLP